ncbi:GntR family transcriptional regulator [soil metagenome]
MPANPVNTVATFLPLYQQIKSLITEALRQGEWRPGQMIPSEMDLAARFGVSQGTVRKAIDALAGDNLLVRKQGKGTFVATHHEPRAAFRFLRIAADDGAPIETESSVLGVRRTRAPADVAKLLELRTGEGVVQVSRSLSNKGRPFVFEEIWLPASRFRGLTLERLADYKGPMYGLFEAEFDTRMIRATERIAAVAAEGAAASSLGVSRGTPLLLIDRVSFTYQDRPVEVRRGWYLTRGHHYVNELS